jgi:hypothetical protein
MRLKVTNTKPTVLKDGTAIWAPFTHETEHKADGRDLWIELQVEVNRWGRGRCVGIKIEPLDGGAVTGELLRKVPIATLVRHAVPEAGSRIRETAPGRFEPLIGTERDDAYSQLLENTRPVRRGAPITDDHLKQVAAVYGEALVNGEPPLRTVEAQFKAKRSTASKWVAMARQRGHLGPARQGKASA